MGISPLCWYSQNFLQVSYFHFYGEGTTPQSIQRFYIFALTAHLHLKNDFKIVVRSFKNITPEHSSQAYLLTS